MEYRGFGRAKVKVSTIGMGTYYDVCPIVAAHIFGWLGKEDKISALRTGIELGINLIDTAEVYYTEPLVAEAIDGVERDKLFIATKVSCWHLRYKDVLNAAERSVKKLKCSYIDLYQIHHPNPWVAIEETMKAMERLVNEGIIRYIGVSNFSLPQMREAEEALSTHELVSNQMEYNLLVRNIEGEMLPYCEKNRIVMLPYRPLAHGALANPSGERKTVMSKISQRHDGKTPTQISLNWLLNKSELIFPIPRASGPARVEENVGALGWKLNVDEVARLEAAAR